MIRLDSVFGCLNIREGADRAARGSCGGRGTLLFALHADQIRVKERTYDMGESTSMMRALTGSAAVASLLVVTACGNSVDDYCDTMEERIGDMEEQFAQMEENPEEMFGESMEAVADLFEDVADTAPDEISEEADDLEEAFGAMADADLDLGNLADMDEEEMEEFEEQFNTIEEEYSNVDEAGETWADYTEENCDVAPDF